MIPYIDTSSIMLGLIIVYLEFHLSLKYFTIYFFNLTVEYGKLYIRMDLHGNGGSSFIAMFAPAICDNSHMSKFYRCSNAS